MEARKKYISNTDFEDAKRIYENRVGYNLKLQKERTDVIASIGRVTCKPVYALESSPCYNASAMDGIAVNSRSTHGASETNPIELQENADFSYVNTGNPINEPYDSVIMIEDVMELGEGKVNIIAPSHPWQHVRPIGEDMVKGEMIIPSGHIVRPVDIGALLAGGLESIDVYKKPLLGIIPTGSELVDSLEELREGKVIESNSRVFEARASELGAQALRYEPCPDEFELLKARIKQAVSECDIVVINAGSSAGTRDYTANLIEELGEVVIHGIAIKPGKPTILGIIDGKPVIGLPGYPVSTYVAFESFVKPILLSMQGLEECGEESVEAVVTMRIPSSLKHKELVRVNVGHVSGRFVATPLTRGAGVTMSLVKADGLLEIQRSSEGLDAGTLASVKLLKPTQELRKTLVSIGSHDIIMDEISDMMKLTSGHVGSMGGIMSMMRRECHIAPIHLLDEESGEYNLPYIKKFFGNGSMALIKGVKRLQGLMLQCGNPKDINDFQDLAREDVVFVNRQRGAGTRILLDYNLKKLGIDPGAVNGYERDMNTHMAVAIAVKTGSADAGLGVFSAAKALNLEFIPLGYEEYDFLVNADYLEDDRVKRFIGILESEEFAARLDNLGGYKLEEAGKVIRV
ncbi:MoeA-1 protein [Peptoclostridium acidaminophilum DSM 3953]|uniref:Molybdopterin molybdenumtransferase n=2 Tax=Peptoclostridium acidaminophilum TaxID=1731 RepID=W8T4I5_PEPAC|nr:molybdopterin biosynthesis protein [Peptoclostridium acidaminophilum]AHM55745.1 MoeA-1 protein [Peptoclostridium acidaminophilum DSM 3953]CAC40786.1 MoeA-1 protein [Peptoclostridium acidaminophilum]